MHHTRFVRLLLLVPPAFAQITLTSSGIAQRSGQFAFAGAAASRVTAPVAIDRVRKPSPSRPDGLVPCLCAKVKSDRRVPPPRSPAAEQLDGLAGVPYRKILAYRRRRRPKSHRPPASVCYAALRRFRNKETPNIMVTSSRMLPGSGTENAALPLVTSLPTVIV